MFGKRNASTIAEERLKLILVQDRSLLSPKQFEQMKEDIIDILSKYFEINKSEINLSIDRENKKTILEAVVPVISVRKVS
ncbi:MAG: cell division topological specificity factor MinE [Caldisericaceae bacterium]